jgi:hypothetical protein
MGGSRSRGRRGCPCGRLGLRAVRRCEVPHTDRNSDQRNLDAQKDNCARYWLSRPDPSAALQSRKSSSMCARRHLPTRVSPAHSFSASGWQAERTAPPPPVTYALAEAG